MSRQKDKGKRIKGKFRSISSFNLCPLTFFLQRLVARTRDKPLPGTGEREIKEES
jgi:hypothetical protein